MEKIPIYYNVSTNKTILGLEKAIERLIQKGANINLTNENNDSPLTLAASKGK